MKTIEDLIERAVQFGVNAMKEKNAMAISLGSIWLEGFIYGSGVIETTANQLREGIKNYKFKE